MYHIPALLPQCMRALDIRPGGVYVDATYGGGGHSRAILEGLSAGGHLYGFDQDEDAIKRAPGDSRLTLIHGNFRFLRNWMRYYGQEGKVDGILADLGVSFHHFDDSTRGFSFRFDGPLDMRMNRQSDITAATFLATATETDIARVLRLYGEFGAARPLARALVAEREAGRPVDTVERLREISSRFISPKKEKKELAMVFQALRIEVNGEMRALEQFLRSTLDVLAPGGHLAVITYHSLEDRLVKNFMRTGNFDGHVEKDFYGVTHSPLKPLHTKPIVPDAAEIEANPRSRSAKLRSAVRI